jgi:hypothetical protein
VDIDKAAQAFQKFTEFKKRILTENDIVDIQGKPYLKKSGLRKWALACNVSDRLVSYERVPSEGHDADGSFYYRVIWEAYHQPTRRSCIGTAICESTEKKAWAHKEHDIFTLACTRAKNRAISDLIGGGEVTAEEMITDTEPRPATEASSDQAVKEERSISKLSPDPDSGLAVTEYPLTYKKDTVGSVKIDSEHSRALFFPEKPVREDSAPIKGFLLPRILEPMRTKHALEYRLDTASGLVQCVAVTPLPQPEQLDELMTAVSWAFAKGSEGGR